MGSKHMSGKGVWRCRFPPIPSPPRRPRRGCGPHAHTRTTRRDRVSLTASTAGYGGCGPLLPPSGRCNRGVWWARMAVGGGMACMGARGPAAARGVPVKRTNVSSSPARPSPSRPRVLRTGATTPSPPLFLTVTRRGRPCSLLPRLASHPLTFARLSPCPPLLPCPSLAPSGPPPVETEEEIIAHLSAKFSKKPARGGQQQAGLDALFPGLRLPDLQAAEAELARPIDSSKVGTVGAGRANHHLGIVCGVAAAQGVRDYMEDRCVCPPLPPLTSHFRFLFSLPCWSEGAPARAVSSLRDAHCLPLPPPVGMLFCPAWRLPCRLGAPTCPLHASLVCMTATAA